MSSPPDDDAAALSTAQTQARHVNLTAEITALASSQTPAIPATNHYALNDPFNLTTRAGDRAFEDISKPLDTNWDGTAQTFTSFSSNLARRANDRGWDRAASHEIINVNGKGFLEDSKSITEADLVAAQIAQIDPRANQNCKALFKCLESSITPSVKSTIFDQTENNPTGAVVLPIPGGLNERGVGCAYQDVNPSEEEHGRAIHCDTTDSGPM